LKFLLRPGWIALIILVVAFSSLCFTVLAPWQFGRSEEAQARNAAIEESFRATPKPIDEVLPGGRAPDAGTEWKHVSFSGQYLPEGETLAWLRTVQGEPAIEVLTPFRLDDGQILLVNRGYVRPLDATHAPGYAAPPSGPVTVTARVRLDESDSKNRPTFERDGHRWAYSVDSRLVRTSTSMPIRPGYFALNSGQPGVLEPLPLPQLQSGPYFSYALQWIAFGIMAPLAIGYLIYAELRPSDLPAERTTEPTTGQSKRRGRRMSVAEAIAEDERREREEAANNH
jgi:cytochrome oxidase assembly protein ShyY1